LVTLNEVRKVNGSFPPLIYVEAKRREREEEPSADAGGEIQKRT